MNTRGGTLFDPAFLAQPEWNYLGLSDTMVSPQTVTPMVCSSPVEQPHGFLNLRLLSGIHE